VQGIPEASDVFAGHIDWCIRGGGDVHGACAEDVAGLTGGAWTQKEATRSYSGTPTNLQARSETRQSRERLASQQQNPEKTSNKEDVRNDKHAATG
jgi:hypothetical protein